MKLREIIEKLDKSESNNQYVNTEDLLYDLQIDAWGLESDINSDKRLKVFFIRKWLCTDTWVGNRAYFLDNELVAVSEQMGRKCKERFEWVSRDAKIKVRDYITSFINKNYDDIDILDFDEDCGNGHVLEYGCQLLNENVIYIPTGEKVKVVDNFRHDYNNMKYVIIKNEQIPPTKVNIKDILVPYCII